MGKRIDIKKLEGARSLGSDFNNYILGDIIEESLEKIKDAVNINGSNNQYGYTFNNIFIDGSRGSGKTTVLLTLRDILSNRNELYRNKLQKYGLQDKKFIIIDSLLDTSVNKESITFYFLSWLKKEIEEKYQTNHDLMEQLYKTIKLFPSKSEKIDDIEEKLDRSDLSFRNELFKLVDGYLNNSCSQDFSSKSNSFIILFLDDLDISFPVERIQEILTEIFLFLSHPNVIVIGAGDYNNLVKMLTKYVSKEIEDKQTEDNLFYKNISKSYLEKTFATHLVRLYRLKYEQIANIEVENESGTKPLKEYLEENINIVKILKFNSPIFKTLFNDITIRELILILKEVSFVENKKLKESQNYKQIEETKENKDKYVVDYCFSHILKKYLNINLNIEFDSRFSTKIDDKNKNSEFEYIANKIQNSLNKISDNLFFDKERHSLITLSLDIDNDIREVALFWLWFYENIFFMNGFFHNLGRILMLDLIYDIEKEKLSSFIKTWEKFNYDLYELKSIFESYDHYLKFERYISVYLNPKEKELRYLLEGLELKKGSNGEHKYLHLISILIFISKHNLFSERYLNELFYFLEKNKEKRYNQYQINLFIDNVKNKILKEIIKYHDATFQRFFYLLLVYFNFLYRVYLKYSGEEIFIIKKDVYFQNVYKLLFNNKLFLSKSTDESIINWWIEGKYRNQREKNKVNKKIKKLEIFLRTSFSKKDELRKIIESNDNEKIKEFLEKNSEDLKSYVLSTSEYLILISIVTLGAFIKKIKKENVSKLIEGIKNDEVGIEKIPLLGIFHSDYLDIPVNYYDLLYAGYNGIESKEIRKNIESLEEKIKSFGNKSHECKQLSLKLLSILEKLKKFKNINRNED